MLLAGRQGTVEVHQIASPTACYNAKPEYYGVVHVKRIGFAAKVTVNLLECICCCCLRAGCVYDGDEFDEEYDYPDSDLNM